MIASPGSPKHPRFVIATRVAGRVREVRVAPGATVEAGQVLAVVG
ncbi:MAG: biotin/lipoyl-binding protein [Thermoanaerobaculum sp.]